MINELFIPNTKLEVEVMELKKMQRADCCVDEIRALSENVKKIKRKQYC